MAAGACEIGVVNHYYLARMLEEDPDAPIGLLWAEQDGRGVHINISGGGVTRYADDVDLAQQFLEWLATDGQDTLVADNHEYPANPAVEAEPLIREHVRHRLRARPAARRRARLAQRRRRAGHGHRRTSADAVGDVAPTAARAAVAGAFGRPGWVAAPVVVAAAGDRPDRHAGDERAAAEHRRCGASSGRPGCPTRSSRRSC